MRAVLLAVLAFTTISAVPLAPRQLVRNESASSNSILEAYYIAGRWVDVDEFNSIAQSRSTAYFANNSMGDAALGSSPVGPSGNKCVGNYEGIIIPVEDCKLRSFCYIYCNAWGPVQTLNDWDTKLSAVVYNSGGGASVAIEKGSSVSDSVEVSTGIKLGDIFEATLGVTYTHTWTHDGSETNTFKVPKGHYGVVVVNALIERHAGTVTWTSTSGMKGGQASYSNADRHFNGPFDLVEGKYSLCMSTAYPVPFCEGSGHHY